MSRGLSLRLWRAGRAPELHVPQGVHPGRRVHGAERDVRLLAIATSAPHLRQRLLLPLRLTLERGQLPRPIPISCRSSRNWGPGGSARNTRTRAGRNRTGPRRRLDRCKGRRPNPLPRPFLRAPRSHHRRRRRRHGPRHRPTCLHRRRSPPCPRRSRRFPWSSVASSNRTQRLRARWPRPPSTTMDRRPRQSFDAPSRESTLCHIVAELGSVEPPLVNVTSGSNVALRAPRHPRKLVREATLRPAFGASRNPLKMASVPMRTFVALV